MSCYKNILKVGKNKEISEIHANQRSIPKEEQMEDKMKRLTVKQSCSFPVEVEIEIERDKTHKSRMLLCESHAELVEKGIPFRMRSTKKE